MKVLVFSSLFPNNISPNHGIFIKERISYVSKYEDCDVKVVAPVPYYPLNIGWRSKYYQVARHEQIADLDVFHPRYVMIPKIGMLLYGWLMFLSVLPSVTRIKSNFDFDLIDAHYVYPDGFAATLLGQHFRRPVVVSARGSDINVYARMPLIRRLLQYTLKKASHVIVVSDALKKAVLTFDVPSEKISLVRNGVDPGKFYSIPKLQARQELGLPKDVKLILSVGALTSVKGFDLLIRCVKILVEEFQQRSIVLAIVGEGQIREELWRMISDFNLGAFIRLVGAVPHKELRRWYSAADLFCLCSRSEGSPNVVLESLACGTPVIATAVGGIPEIINCSSLGILTNRSERQFAEAIELALKTSWKREQIIEHSCQYRWEDAACSIRDVFQTAIQGTNGNRTAI